MGCAVKKRLAVASEGPCRLWLVDLAGLASATVGWGASSGSLGCGGRVVARVCNS